MSEWKPTKDPVGECTDCRKTALRKKIYYFAFSDLESRNGKKLSNSSQEKSKTFHEAKIKVSTVHPGAD